MPCTTKKIESYITKLGYSASYQDEKSGFFCIENEMDGIKNLIIAVAPPIIIFEQYIFTLKKKDQEIFEALLKKNRDCI